MKACTDLAQQTLLSLMELTDRQPSLPRKAACATALMIACIPCLTVLDLAWRIEHNSREDWLDDLLYAW